MVAMLMAREREVGAVGTCSLCLSFSGTAFVDTKGVMKGSKKTTYFVMRCVGSAHHHSRNETHESTAAEKKEEEGSELLLHLVSPECLFSPPSARLGS